MNDIIKCKMTFTDHHQLKSAEEKTHTDSRKFTSTAQPRLPREWKVNGRTCMGYL